MSNLRKDFSRRLKEIRIAKEFTQELLADEIGVNAQHIARLETNKTATSFDTLEKLALAFGIETKDLFDFKKEKIKKSGIRDKLDILLSDVSDKKLKLIYDVAKRILGE